MEVVVPRAAGHRRQAQQATDAARCRLLTASAALVTRRAARPQAVGRQQRTKAASQDSLAARVRSWCCSAASALVMSNWFISVLLE
jgi:hypothetical protein